MNFASIVSYPEKFGSKPEGPTMQEVSADELRRRHEGWELQIQQLLSVGIRTFISASSEPHI